MKNQIKTAKTSAATEPKTLQLKATVVFEKNWAALHSPARFVKNEGGSRSSKTYSLCQVFTLYCLQNPNKLVSIVRRTGPALMTSVFRDFKQVLQDMDLWEDKQWSIGRREYTFPNGSVVEFFSADQEQKLRGRKRNIAWVNEANELTYESFQQLNLRTTEKIFVDYNPSENDSFLYQLPAEKTISIHSTYKENPFLEDEIIAEIEAYKDTDEDYYTIFALGKRAFSKQNVYKEWTILKEKPKHLLEFVYGLDFGWTHPTALVKVWFSHLTKELFVEELVYESHLTSADLVQKMDALKVSKSVEIIAETARPEIVHDLRVAGYTVVSANKDVKDGINTVKTFVVQVSQAATNVIKENQNYKYKKINGVVTEEVVKLFDDAMDALRYAAMYIKKYKLETSGSSGKIYSFEF